VKEKMVNMDCEVRVNSTSLKEACHIMEELRPPGTSKQKEFQEKYTEGDDETGSRKFLRIELEQANARAAHAELRLRCMSHGIRVICNQMKRADYFMAEAAATALTQKQQGDSFSDDEDDEDATTISMSDSQTIASFSSAEAISISCGGDCVVPPRSRAFTETARHHSGGGACDNEPILRV
jgi:hypothetical protein